MFGIDDMLIGAGVSLIGSFFESDAKETASKNNMKIQQQQLALQKEKLDMDKQYFAFNQQRYNEWKSVYGSLQEDLGTYFKNLKGSDLSSKDKQLVQKAIQGSEIKIKEMVAQRGLNGAGLEGSLLAQNIYQGELAKANIDATADDRAIAMKQNFLALGLNQGGAISAQMGNALAGQTHTLNSMGYTNQAMVTANNQMANAKVGFWQDFTFGVGNYLRSNNPTGAGQSAIGGSY